MNVVTYAVGIALVGFVIIGGHTVMTRTPKRILIWEAAWWLYGMYLVATSDSWTKWLGVALVTMSTLIFAVNLGPAGVLCLFSGHRWARQVTAEGMYAVLPQGVGLVDINGDPVKVVCTECGKDRGA